MRPRTIGWAAIGIVLAVLGLTAPAHQEEALVVNGQALFVAHGCYGCHTVAKTGTPIGPDLSRVGARYPAGYLLRWLRDPAAVRPSAHMPKLGLDEAEVRALAAYLDSLR